MRRWGVGYGPRVFYLADEARDLVMLLMIAARFGSAVDRRDAYTVFAERMRAGQFDDQFAEMGVVRPPG